MLESLLVALLAFALSGCSAAQSLQGFLSQVQEAPQATASQAISGPDWFDLSMVPAYEGQPSVEIGGGTPRFDDADFLRPAFEEYSPLDALGRCGTAFALLGRETMPAEDREDIASVHPSGWQSSRYPWIEGEALFNRCHLIGFQLAGENANELNLVTGTRSMNVEGMLPYENRVASYVRTTGNHVLYRVTPFFEGDDLVARGVLMEAESVEDLGVGVSFCVWCYNVEPGVSIDYRTGENEPDGTVDSSSPVVSGNSEPEAEPGVNAYGETPEEVLAQFADASYVLNAKTLKFHRPDCPSVVDMNPRNRQAFEGTRDEAIAQGYDPCGYCKP